MEYVPHNPSTGPLRIDALTLGQQMGFNFSALTGTNTGGSIILSYHVEYD
jgi:hypothetical protein